MDKNGQALIWVILAVVIIAIVLALGSQFLSIGLKGKQIGKEQLISSQLAQECFEAVRSIAEEDWHIVSSANTSEAQENYYHPEKSGDKWVLVSDIEEFSSDSPFAGYKRGLLFYKVSRDDNGNIEADYNETKQDPSTLKIIVKVQYRTTQRASWQYFLARWRNEVKVEATSTWLGNGYSVISDVTTTQEGLKIFPKGEWYDSRWGYRQRILINPEKVSGTLSNFPVLVSSTNAVLKDTSNGGHVAKSNGDDILFTEADGTTKLSHEIEKYDPVNGILIVWIKIPSLASNKAAAIYLYYGNSNASNQQDPTNVWGSSYVMVQHMKDYTTSQVNDSTVNANHGTKTAANEPIEVDGKIGKAQSFDGSDDYVYTGNIGIAGNVELSISFWVKSTAVQNLGNFVSVGAASDKNLIGINSGTTGVRLYLNYWSGDNVVDLDISPADHSLDFVHIVYTYNKTTEKLYANNVLKHTRNITLTFTDNPVRIGGRTGGYDGQYSKSVIDEVTIWDTVLTPSWIKTCYNNQSDPSTFYTIDSEESY